MKDVCIIKSITCLAPRLSLVRSSNKELSWLSWGSLNDVAESLMESEVDISTLPLFNEGLFGEVAGLAAPSSSLALSVGLFVKDDLTAALLIL